MCRKVFGKYLIPINLFITFTIREKDVLKTKLLFLKGTLVDQGSGVKVRGRVGPEATSTHGSSASKEASGCKWRQLSHPA